ncbi:MAG: PaaI family thioesterase [Jatrophihabitans sp.]|uniref:PaaI family thioesterase n=1 Tax=Jatrophihabitans sp. TaxID=1932789 RepID=UPI003F7FE56C
MTADQTEASDLAEQMNAGLQALIPVAYNMGVRFTALRRGYAESSVPFEGNGNHFGVLYAGVIFTVAEVLGGGLHMSTFDASTHYPLVRSMTIDFLKPGKTDLTARVSLDEAEIARLEQESAGGNKANFELVAEIVDASGEVIGRTRGDYQMRPYGR